MPFTYRECDCLPLLVDNEFEINDEMELAGHVGRIILGHFAHVKRILRELTTTPPRAEESAIGAAIGILQSTGKSKYDIEKRDGWVFQIISWLALFNANRGHSFYCQPPHDAPAQHGIDNVGIILDEHDVITNVIITEDKCTDDNHRVLIPRIWKEFEEFEMGGRNNKLVSRVSAMIDNLKDGDVLAANENNIYKSELRQYRVGINRNDEHQSKAQRIKLFKNYDTCVTGDEPLRRFASTLHQPDIRAWMEQFSVKVIQHLESLKPTTNV